MNREEISNFSSFHGKNKFWRKNLNRETSLEFHSKKTPKMISSFTSFAKIHIRELDFQTAMNFPSLNKNNLSLFQP